MKLTRRNFIQAATGAAAMSTPLVEKANAELKRMKITRIRYYESPITRPMVNQSFHVVTIETDAGITGIGEGGSPDLVKQLAAQLIGQDPTRIDHLWQLMFRGMFYPAGREKTHSIGALDLALWDLKGKALGVPAHDLLGGQSRDHIECYCTGFPNPKKLSTVETRFGQPWPTRGAVPFRIARWCWPPTSIANRCEKASARPGIGRSTSIRGWTFPMRSN